MMRSVLNAIEELYRQLKAELPSDLEKIFYEYHNDTKLEEYRPSGCFLTLMEWYSMAKRILRTDNYALLHSIVSKAAVLLPWRLTKNIYHFQSSLVEELVETDVGVLPIEVLNNLRDYCGFIALPDNFYSDLSNLVYHKRLGFFYYLEYDFGKKAYELRIEVLEAHLDGTYNLFPLILIFKEGWTLDKAIQESLDRLSHNGLTPLDITKHQHMGFSPQTWKGILNLILYLNSTDADVNQPNLVPTPKKTKKGVRIPAGSNPPKLVEVGFRRSYLSQPKEQSILAPNHPNSKGSPKRSHLRRAHWHHFWKGSRTGSDRQLVLKWVEKTLINPDNNEYPNEIRVPSSRNNDR